ncbi:hypothetical protein [Bacillus cereus]|uniref:hypothetical protein n=1 Tax=Bacillus cereus TaxID=1396 RepID=UPI0015CF1FBA|nr:hypothetical protein [Bacillus cereus]
MNKLKNNKYYIILYLRFYKGKIEVLYSMFGCTFVQRHENGYFLDKKVDTSIPIIVLGQEGGY